LRFIGHKYSGTSTTITSNADGTFTVPGGPFPCGTYMAAFEEVSTLPTCYTETGSTEPIDFELDGNPNTMDGPDFIAGPAILSYIFHYTNQPLNKAGFRTLIRTSLPVQ